MIDSRSAVTAAGLDPVLVGTWPGFARSPVIAGAAYDIAVAGNYAYVADGGAGMRVFDIRNPRNPEPIGGFVTSGYAEKVTLAGDHAYVAYNSHGLLIFDIRNPESPRLVGQYVTNTSNLNIPIPFSTVSVFGDYALVSPGIDKVGLVSGITIINISDPTSPRFVAHTLIAETVLDVTVSGNYAYTAGGQWFVFRFEGFFRVIDIRNPTNPYHVGGYHTGGYDTIGVETPESVTVIGNHAYVMEGNRGIEVIDIGVRSSPRRIGAYDTIGNASDMAVSGQYAYVADGVQGVEVFDISDPANLRRVGGRRIPGGAAAIAVAGHHAYVAAGANGIHVLFIGPSVRLDALGMDTEAFRMIVDGTPGVTAQVQYSTNLTTWENFGLPVTLNVMPSPVSDPDAVSSNRRFYRVVVQ